jgi:hypothetical protein
MRRASYATKQALLETERRLSERDREIVRLVSCMSLVSGQQIRRLVFRQIGNGRNAGQLARRALLRLIRLGVLARLERRIGGVKSGSDGFVYRLGPVGQRLWRSWSKEPDARGRARPEPGARFVDHRLAVSELYVRLVEAARDASGGRPEILDFHAEPDCWRPFIGTAQVRTILKPDAFVRLGLGHEELWWFVEVDRGTVSQSTRAAQAAAYRAYWRSGAAGDVMPRVLWLGASSMVTERVRSAIRFSSEPVGLFVVASFDEAVAIAAGLAPELAA